MISSGVLDGRVSSPLMTQALWRKTLCHNDFSDFNVCLSDYEGDARRTEVLVSTAVESKACSATPEVTVYIDRSNDQALSFARGLTKTFDALDLVDMEDIWTNRQILDGKLCLFLGDMTGEFLTNWPHSKINDLLQIMSSAVRTLWVMKKKTNFVTYRADGLITGFVRPWNLQRPDFAISTLSLSASSAIDQQISLIWRIVQSHAPSSRPPFEMEYHESEGQVTISRLLIDELTTDRMMDRLEEKSATAMNFQKGIHPLKIQDSSSESETKIVFTSDTNASNLLGEDEIEILPQYFSLTTKYSDQPFDKGDQVMDAVRECSGIVRRVASTQECPFKVGDRVCAIGSGPASNHFRVPTGMVQHIPQQLSYEEAASVPIIFVTALYCLKQIAKAQAGESILIHNAAQTLGQAIISLAQSMALDIYAAVEQKSEQTLLTERFGIPIARIFRTMKTDTRNAVWTTENHRRFSIIVGCSDQHSLQDALRCISSFGTIVCLGYTSHVSSLSRSGQPKTICTVSMVNVDLLFELKRGLYLHLFAEVMEMARSGAIKFPILTKAHSLSADSKGENFLRHSNGDRLFIRTNCDTNFQVYEPTNLRRCI